MLKRDENKFCWYSNGKVGLPKDSIEEAKQAIFDVINFSLPQFMYDISSDYIAQDQLCIIKEVHIEELGKELSRVYNDWEKRHGYDKQSYIVFTDEAETYYISDYIK